MITKNTKGLKKFLRNFLIYCREMARRQAEYEAELYPSSNNNASPKASSTSSLKKSKSHTSLSQISDERGFNPLRY